MCAALGALQRRLAAEAGVSAGHHHRPPLQPRVRAEARRRRAVPGQQRTEIMVTGTLRGATEYPHCSSIHEERALTGNSLTLRGLATKFKRGLASTTFQEALFNAGGSFDYVVNDRQAKPQLQLKSSELNTH